MGRRQTAITRAKISAARKEQERKRRDAALREIEEIAARHAGYKVGYGKPPREHQFKPGQSGNPAGRKHVIDPRIDPNAPVFRAVVEQVKKEIGEAGETLSREHAKAASESRLAADRSRADADAFRISASEAARAAEEAAQRSMAYAAAKSVEKATMQKCGAAIAADVQESIGPGSEPAKPLTEPDYLAAYNSLRPGYGPSHTAAIQGEAAAEAHRKSNARTFWEVLNAPISPVEIRITILLFWLLLWLAGIDWLRTAMRSTS